MYERNFLSRAIRGIAAVTWVGMAGIAQAAPTTFSSVLFTMYDPTGAVAGTPDPSVTGTGSSRESVHGETAE